MKVSIGKCLPFARCHVFVSIPFIVVISFVGCAHPTPSLTQVSTPLSTPGFTYSARDGAIWQIDLDGNRAMLVAPDGIHKIGLEWSEDRAWLAYVGIQFPEQDAQIAELFVMDQETKNVKKIAGPYRYAYYEWDDARHIRFTGPDPSTPADSLQEVINWFTMDVETGNVVAIDSEAWTKPSASLPENQLLEAPNGEWAVQSIEEGSKRIFYLLDADGNRLSTIYEQPADNSMEFTMWSKDSRWFIYVPVDSDNNGALYLYEPANLASMQLTHYKETQGGGTIMSNFKQAPDGKWLLFRVWSASDENQLCLACFESAPNLSCFDDPWKVSSVFSTYYWSTDGKFVAFLESEEVDLYTIELESGKVRNLTNDGGSVEELYVTPY